MCMCFVMSQNTMGMKSKLVVVCQIERLCGESELALEPEYFPPSRSFCFKPCVNGFHLSLVYPIRACIHKASQ